MKLSLNHRKKLLLLLLSALLALFCAACSEDDVDTALGFAAALLGDESASAEASDSAAPMNESSDCAEASGSSSQSATVLPSPANWLDGEELDEAGTYSSQEDVAAYLVTYHHLPDNYITKSQARKLGWSGGSLEPYAPGKCIGGSRFGNNEGLLPKNEVYYECDIDTLGARKRGAERLVYCEDFEHIYYTSDHYESFTLIYGEK